LKGSCSGQNGSDDRAGVELDSIGLHLLRRLVFDHKKTRVCHERLKNHRRAYMFLTRPSKMLSTRVSVNHQIKRLSNASKRQDVP
jgi:hypothetical protein